MTATTYFSIESTDITSELLPDTEATSDNIVSLAQRIEYDVMHRLGLSAAPTGTVDLQALKRAIILLTAADLESRDPYSYQEGSMSIQKTSRFEWKSEAEQIIRRFERYIRKT